MDNEIDIVKLDFPENIRRRPGMYIGSTENPSVLLREAVDNSIDELYGSNKTTRIFISTNPEGWNLVSDNGRGIPIVWDEKYNMTKTQLACTSTHTGSKFDKTDVAIGLNGVGISATNALSKKFLILSRVTKENYDKSIPQVKSAWESLPHDELFYVIYFEKGKLIAEGCNTRDQIMANYGFSFPITMSTVTAFQPDEEVFDSLDCKIPKRNLTYVMTILNKIYHRVVSIEVNGTQLQDEFTPYKFEFIKEVKGRDYKGKERKAIFYVNFECDKNLSVNETSGSVNSLVCDRGTHIEAVKSAYIDALKAYFGLTHNTVMCGIRINAIVVATEVDFSSQTKERCTKIEGMSSYDLAKGMHNDFRKIFKENDDYFTDHVARLNEYVSSLTKISTINKIKNAIGTVGGSNNSKTRSKVPKSVRDAGTSNRKEAELFIVEGKSASGSIISSRDARTQAVLELRGVPLNAIDRDLDEILDNEEMSALISAIGVGVNEYYDMKSARYGKIIIAADADPDGLRIASLVLGIFAKRMTFLLREGMVYVLRSPLYIQKDKNGNETYIYPEDAAQLDRNKPYTRIKGLGELNEEQAEPIITNKDTRRLLQITLENVEEGLSLLTSTLARKQLMIDENVIGDPYELGFWY